MVFFHRGGQICSRHRYGPGGQNPYFSTKSQYYHCSFCPRGGPNSIANFDGEAMAGFAPLDPPLGLLLLVDSDFIDLMDPAWNRPIGLRLQRDNAGSSKGRRMRNSPAVRSVGLAYKSV